MTYETTLQADRSVVRQDTFPDELRAWERVHRKMAARYGDVLAVTVTPGETEPVSGYQTWRFAAEVRTAEEGGP